MRKRFYFHVFKLYQEKAKNMECTSIRPYAMQNFCKKDNTANNNKLNIGVVTPPNTLPNYSLYETVKATEKQNPKKTKIGGGSKLNAGMLSAICAFGAMFLAAISFLPFVRKH